MTSREAKSALLAQARKTKEHYNGCTRCATEPTPCLIGEAMWEEMARRQYDVVKTCVMWHHRHTRGAERANIMLEKMLRVLAAVTRI